MLRLIEEIYELSDNSTLFDQLRTGHDLTTLANGVADPASVPPKTVVAELLQAFRRALVPALRSDDDSGLNELIERADIHSRVTIVGELILTLYALKEGRHAGERVDAILGLAFRLARDLAAAFEADPPQDADDEQLLAHGVAMREWAHLLAGYYQAAGMDRHHAEMLMVRARVTNNTLSAWPHLVGAAMTDVALALEPIGMAEMAVNCLNGVRMDLHYLVDRVDDPALPEFEKVAALYWLQRACEEVSRLAPDEPGASQEAQRVRQLREERCYPDAVSAPRFGPIAKTYLASTPYLALILRDLREDGENVSAVCQRYGCPSGEVDFYLSAMGSYVVRDTILRGVHTFYDEAHEEVFAAMDYLLNENK